VDFSVGLVARTLTEEGQQYFDGELDVAELEPDEN
jgi:hypothetical protein